MVSVVLKALRPGKAFLLFLAILAGCPYSSLSFILFSSVMSDRLVIKGSRIQDNLFIFHLSFRILYTLNPFIFRFLAAILFEGGYLDSIRQSVKICHYGIHACCPHLFFSTDQGIIVLKISLTIRCPGLEPYLVSNSTIN